MLAISRSEAFCAALFVIAEPAVAQPLTERSPNRTPWLALVRRSPTGGQRALLLSKQMTNTGSALRLRRWSPIWGHGSIRDPVLQPRQHSRPVQYPVSHRIESTLSF